MYRNGRSILAPSTGVAFVGGAGTVIGGGSVLTALAVAVLCLICLCAALLVYRRFMLRRTDSAARN